MIRAIGQNGDGTPVVFLGLDDENLRRLTSDQPVRANLSELLPGQTTGLPDITVVVFHAEGDAVEVMRRMAQR
jgi:hypothetical protein